MSFSIRNSHGHVLVQLGEQVEPSALLKAMNEAGRVFERLSKTKSKPAKPKVAQFVYETSDSEDSAYNADVREVKGKELDAALKVEGGSESEDDEEDEAESSAVQAARALDAALAPPAPVEDDEDESEGESIEDVDADDDEDDDDDEASESDLLFNQVHPDDADKSELEESDSDDESDESDESVESTGKPAPAPATDAVIELSSSEDEASSELSDDDETSEDEDSAPPPPRVKSRQRAAFVAALPRTKACADLLALEVAHSGGGKTKSKVVRAGPKARKTKAVAFSPTRAAAASKAVRDAARAALLDRGVATQIELTDDELVLPAPAGTPAAMPAAAAAAAASAAPLAVVPMSDSDEDDSAVSEHGAFVTQQEGALDEDDDEDPAEVVGEDTRPYYALKGRNGEAGVIYRTWQDIQPHVTGVKGVEHKKFKTLEEALAFAK